MILVIQSYNSRPQTISHAVIPPRIRYRLMTRRQILWWHRDTMLVENLTESQLQSLALTCLDLLSSGEHELTVET
jgi:hypothetical protein